MIKKSMNNIFFIKLLPFLSVFLFEELEIKVSVHNEITRASRESKT